MASELYLQQSYLSEVRWLAYHKQLELIRKTGAQTVLEIGPGPGIMGAVLSRFGIKVTTLDHEQELQPDICCDLRDIRGRVEPASFDCVLACQVLEHIPWRDFKLVAGQLAEATKRWCIISLPYAGVTVKASLNWGRQANHVWRAGGRIPAFWRSKVYVKDEHEWEPGLKTCPVKQVRKVLRADFRIISEEVHPLNNSQIFFLLEKNSSL